MSNPQPFNPTKKYDLRASAATGAGRLSPRAMQRVTAPAHPAVMKKAAETYFAGSAYDRVDYDSLDEDTVEMVLSPEDMQLLSRAAEEALAEVREKRQKVAEAPSTPQAVKAVAAVSVEKPAQAAAVTKTAKPVSAPEPPNTAKAIDSAEAAGAVKAAQAPSTTKAVAAVTATPVPTVTAPARASRRWSPAHVVGMIGIIAATAAALAGITHRATRDDSSARAPVQMSVPARTSERTSPAGTNSIAPTQVPVPAAANSSALDTPTIASSAAASTLPPAANPVTAPPPAAADPVPTTAAVASPAAAPLSEPVRIQNPFDRTEEFEFPAGTSLEDAHRSVAELLLQRARDRGIQLQHPSHT